LKYEPDIALVSWCSNDALRVTVSDAEFDQRRIRKTELDKKLIKYKTGQLLLAGLDGLLREKNELGFRVSLEESRENLNEIIKLAKERGIKVILLTRPFVGNRDDKDYWRFYGPFYNAAVVEITRDNNVDIIDIYSYFENKKEYFRDDCHFTKEGHKLAARIVYDHINGDVEKEFSEKKETQ